MTIGAPLGFLALLGLAPLLAAYFLRRRQKPLNVSALFLWRTPDIRAQAGPKWHRLSRELSLLLESAAVISLAVFLADPQCGPAARERHLVLVVDGSLSMAAHRSQGGTTADRVRERAAREVDATHATSVTVIQTGPTPRLLAGPKERPSAALSALEHWEPRGPTTGFDPSLAFARELAGTTGGVTVLTDGAPPADLPTGVSWLSLGEPLDNVAFVAAQRKDDGRASTVTVRVQSFARAPRSVKVTLHAEPLDPASAQVPVEETITLGPGEVRAVSWQLEHAGPIHLDLPEDALPEDGHLVLPPAPERTVRVQLSSALDEGTTIALRRGLSALDGVTVVTSGGELTIGPEPTSSVVLATHAPLRSYVGPFFANRSDPLLEDVELAGVVWTAGAAGASGPVLSAGDVPLVAEDPQGRVLLNLDLPRSNLARTPAWPILLSNLLRRARDAQPGFSRHTVMLGQEVPLVVDGAAPARIEGPEGARPVLGTGALLLPAFERPGRYRLLRDDKQTDRLEVLPLAPLESDLRDRVSTEHPRGGTLGEGGAPVASRRLPWPLVLLLALVALDFAVTGRSG